MILNVSGRTDIVAFYMDWFLNTLKNGYVCVRNPYFKDSIKKIHYKDVDLIVFCTKNPINLLNHINEIEIPFIIHITVTCYGRDIEPGVTNKLKIIEAIKKLSEKIGKDKIFVRYDPILLNDKYTVDYHIKAFSRLCQHLKNYTNTIIISFVDYYVNVKKNSSNLNLNDFTEDDYEKIGLNFSKIADECGISVQTCSEEKTLFEYGFIKEDCVSKELAKKITGKTYPKWNARNNKFCNCVQMYDIGEYNTCLHFCKYCYANFDEKKVIFNNKQHKINSNVLIGEIENKSGKVNNSN